MSARAALREATADDHARVDSLFGRFDLARRDDYRRFLLAQAEALLAIEAELDRQNAAHIVPDWTDRRRGDRLVADLAELGAAAPAETTAPDLADPAAQLGAIYVLEGSRLGGTLLRRALAPDLPCRFLAAPQAEGGWRKLLEMLDENLYGSVRIGLATGAARGVFALFEAAGRRHVEAEPA